MAMFTSNPAAPLRLAAPMLLGQRVAISPSHLRFPAHFRTEMPPDPVSASRNDFDAFMVVRAGSLTSVNQFDDPRVLFSPTGEELRREFSYLFRAEVGGLVKVSVGSAGGRYSVNIVVSSLPKSLEGDLTLKWGMFRSDSSFKFAPAIYSNSSSGSWPANTTFPQENLGEHALKLEFDLNEAPFYLAFALSSSSDSSGSNSDIKTHRRANFCVPVGLGRGHALPLGVSVSEDGFVNFSLFSRNAGGVILCLYGGKSNLPPLEVELDPYVNKTGDIWHVSIEKSNLNYDLYGYRCKGNGEFSTDNVLLDPYAKKLGCLSTNGRSVFLGQIDSGPAFDWSGDALPSIPMEKLVVYRLNVVQFTKDKSSNLPKGIAATFSGVIQKLQHLKNLGVNAVLLEPVFPFVEQKGSYFPFNFFSVLNSFGGLDDGVAMKQMVKSLHKNGIEVFLEVVFSHTAEGKDCTSKAFSFEGIDNSSYYFNYGVIESGNSKALKCSNPVVQQLVLDSLRHWLIEFHVDGFSFINASHLVRGASGDFLSRPSLVEAIAFDPLLRKTKIVADFWSPLDGSNVKIDFPHWRRWAEMNTRFCSDVRNFLRGKGLISDLATRLCGSGDIFSDSRGPAFSFNFIARNSGLSLVDLVSFSKDGELGSELSWNCGEEGPTNNKVVLERRLRQIRNFLFILFISLGIPVINMGDEFGYSNGGSPFHCDRQPINWGYLNTAFGIQMTQFIGFLTSFRTKRSDLFQKREFLKLENIDWHGAALAPPMWEDPSCKFLGMRLKADMDDSPSSSRGDVFVSFNASSVAENATLPELESGFIWLRRVDTSLSFPGFFSSDLNQNMLELAGLSDYEMIPHSCALFEAHRL